MKYFNLMHITGLRFVNYLILMLLCYHQIRRRMNLTGSFVPFLQVFFMAFATGICSFIFFSGFLFIYTRFDPQLSNLFAQSATGSPLATPSAIILIEGSGVSVIVALIVMLFFSQFEEGKP
jgi:hypothetical protein